MKKKVIIALVVIFFSIVLICNLNPGVENKIQKLNYSEKIKLKVPEPSGLSFDRMNGAFWTVSDEDSSVYQLSSEGNIIKSFKVDGYDLEGISVINDSMLVVILERIRTVLFLTKDGREINRFKLNLTGEPNKGLEGISYNPNLNTLYILNEKNPGLLISTDTSGNVLNKKELTFASDYSGLCYDKYNNELWITSDEDKAIFKCTVDGKLISKYKINIEQIEGISIDFKTSKIFIISDPLETLFIFDLP